MTNRLNINIVEYDKIEELLELISTKEKENYWKRSKNIYINNLSFIKNLIKGLVNRNLKLVDIFDGFSLNVSKINSPSLLFLFSKF